MLRDVVARVGPCGWMKAGAGLCVISLLGLAALQHGMPEGADSGWGLNPLSVSHFHQSWPGVMRPRLSMDAFVLCFRLLLAGAWVGYGVMVGAGLRGGTLAPGPTLTLIAALALLLALFCPPSLSADVYAYAGYARMQVLHGLNPYLHTPSALRDRGDPVAEFLWWEVPCVYGPVWLLPSIGLLGALRPAGLWWQVTAFKLAAAASLMLAALAGRAVARHHDPGRASLTLAAIGLNPLFVIEGPMNGHNDLLTAALIVAGAALFLKQRDLSGALVLGLATGIKLISVVLVPWLMLESGRRRRGFVGLVRAGLVGLLLLAPTALCYVPLWEGEKTFTAQRARLQAEPPRAGSDTNLPAQAVAILASHWLLIGIYLALSLLLWRRGREGDWLTAWAVLAIALIFLVMGMLHPRYLFGVTGVPYPWYLLWPLSVSLTRWDRWHVALSAVCLGMAVVGTMGYSVGRWWW